MSHHVIVKNETVNEIVKRIIEFDPLRIMLFGSHALDLAHKHSDVDLLVIVKNGTDTDKTRTDMSLSMKNICADSDIFVITSNEMIKQGNMGLGMVYFALRSGITIYDKNFSKETEMAQMIQHAKTDREIINGEKLPATHLMGLLAWNIITVSLKIALIMDNTKPELLSDIDILYRKFEEKYPKHDLSMLTAMINDKLHACGYVPKYGKSEIRKWRNVALEMFDDVYARYKHMYMNDEIKGCLDRAECHRHMMKFTGIKGYIRCISARQCTEEALKAAQTHGTGIQAPIHDLVHLHDSLSFSTTVSKTDLRWLSKCSVSNLPSSLYSDQDTECACKIAETIYNAVKTRIAGKPKNPGF